MLLVGEASALAIGEFLSGRSDVDVTPAEGSAYRAVAAARERLGRAAIGYVAADASAELDALAAGADDATVLAQPTPAEVDRFIARVGLRARLRGAQDASRTAVAHTEKLAALGVVVAGVAHEINNPSAAVGMSVEYLRTALPPLVRVAERIETLAASGSGADAAEIRRLAQLAGSKGPCSEPLVVVDEIRGAMDVIADVVRDLRIFARNGDDAHEELLAVHAVVDQVLRSLRGELAPGALIERDYAPESPLVFLPRSRLVQVVTNILINAIHAMREIERPMHRLRISTRIDGEAVVLSVSDTGPGIRPEALERIFEPFFTTKPAGVGTGLGLSVSREIVQRLGGELLAESEPGVGATFAILLPAAPASVLERQSLHAPPASIRAPRKTRVLLVDDDERVLRACARLLSERYEVLLATDGAEAVAMLRSGSSADVVVSDLAMRDLGGLDLYRWLAAERPELARSMIVLTAGLPEHFERSEAARAGVAVLEKPIQSERLIEAIDAAARRTALRGLPGGSARPRVATVRPG